MKFFKWGLITTGTVGALSLLSTFLYPDLFWFSYPIFFIGIIFLLVSRKGLIYKFLALLVFLSLLVFIAFNLVFNSVSDVNTFLLFSRTINESIWTPNISVVLLLLFGILIWLYTLITYIKIKKQAHF
jgi:hypothetical protein